MNTSLELTENETFEVTKFTLPYLEKILTYQTPKILSTCYPRRRIPILKVQKASVHQPSEKCQDLLGYSIYRPTHDNAELWRIRRFQLSNEFLNQSNQILTNRLNSAKTLKSSRVKSSTSQRYFISPKPPRTQPSIPRYDSQPDLKMDLQGQTFQFFASFC